MATKMASKSSKREKKPSSKRERPPKPPPSQKSTQKSEKKQASLREKASAREKKQASQREKKQASQREKAASRRDKKRASAPQTTEIKMAAFIQPREIIFQGPFDQSIFTYITLINPSLQRVTFKMRSNCKKNFNVAPVYGFCDKQGAAPLKLTCKAFKTADLRGKHRITVVLALAPMGKDVPKEAAKVWARGKPWTPTRVMTVRVPIRYYEAGQEIVVPPSPEEEAHRVARLKFKDTAGVQVVDYSALPGAAPRHMLGGRGWGDVDNMLNKCANDDAVTCRDEDKKNNFLAKCAHLRKLCAGRELQGGCACTCDECEAAKAHEVCNRDNDQQKPQAECAACKGAGGEQNEACADCAGVAPGPCGYRCCAKCGGTDKDHTAFPDKPTGEGVEQVSAYGDVHMARLHRQIHAAAQTAAKKQHTSEYGAAPPTPGQDDDTMSE